MTQQYGPFPPGSSIPIDLLNRIDVVQSQLDSLLETLHGTETFGPLAQLGVPDDGDTQAVLDRRLGGLSIAFIGEIVTEGPDEESDYSDERYWVREVWFSDGEAQPDNSPNEDYIGRNPVSISTEEQIETAGIARRHLVAMNLADLRDRSHTLTPGTFVHVFGQLDFRGVARHWFNGPVAGSSSAFAMVREVFEDPRGLVRVQQLSFTESEDDASVLDVTVAENPILVHVHPGARSLDYGGLVWEGEYIEGITPVIYLRSVGGLWYAEQTLKYRLLRLPNNVKFSDCLIPQLPSGQTAGVPAGVRR